MLTNYVPILKWKKGEQIALSKLDTKVKETIIPLIELTEMIEPNSFIDVLKEFYPYPIFLDTTIASEDDIEYLQNIISDAAKANLKIYPVLYSYNIDLYDFDSSVDTLCIKIGIPESIDGPAYSMVFDSINKFCKKNPSLKINLLLDIGIVTSNSDANKQYRDLKNLLNDYVVTVDFYHSIIICATSFPEDLSRVSAGEKISFKRFDFLIFKKVLEDFKELSDKLLYSDYGVTKFTDSDIDFSLIGNNILPKLKYTTNDSYLFWKGKKNYATRSWEISYYNLASDLINSKFYYGDSFSFGDLDMYTRYEKAKMSGNNKCGNSTNWVTISANHHITVVSEQISKLFSSSTVLLQNS